jgi:hypothetical protein
MVDFSRTAGKNASDFPTAGFSTILAAKERAAGSRAGPRPKRLGRFMAL